MTNLHAIVLSAMWLTNVIVRPLEMSGFPPPSGAMMYQTNIISLRIEVGVVGAGIPAILLTNVTVIATNAVKLPSVPAR